MGDQLHLSDSKYVDYSSHQKNNLSYSILKTISYFDIFGFPLTTHEIKRFCDTSVHDVTITEQLNELIKKGKLVKIENHYLPVFSSKNNIVQRKKGEARAKAIKKRVYFFSRLICNFPFVESVCISGSYSKGVVATDGDIDYFIITRPGRLWLARTFLILFKKVILFNSRKYFCVNYFIDADNLEIPDKNIFSATEIATLIPVYNDKLLDEFIGKNNWTKNILPSTGYLTDKTHLVSKVSPVKKWMEYIFIGKMGDKLDNFCFNLTLERWKKKFAHFNEEDFDLNMRSRKNVSKHHPQGFQSKVLNALDERMAKFTNT